MALGPSISPHALVEGSLGPDCAVGPFAVLEAGATLGARCRVHAHAYVGAGAVIGADVEIFPGAVVGRTPKSAGATAREPEMVSTLGIGEGCSIGPHATVYYGVRIGAGTLIGDGASLREGTTIGRRCIVSRCVTLNYDVTLGDGVKVMDNTHITGGTRIGDGAFVSVNVSTTNDNTPTRGLDDRLSGPRIEADAVIGAGAVLLPGVVVGRRAVVAAGAVVTRDVPPGETVMGMPARSAPRDPGTPSIAG